MEAFLGQKAVIAKEGGGEEETGQWEGPRTVGDERMGRAFLKG